MSNVNKMLEHAWGVIANVGGGDWSEQSKVWRDAATKWREDWHAHLKGNPVPVSAEVYKLPPFPPHWFTVARVGSNVQFALVPATSPVQSYQWRLYVDGLRASDVVPLVETLKREPQSVVFILTYVDTIDLAHYLMETARTALQAIGSATLEEWFKPAAPLAVADVGKPAEPAPPGDPETFTMEELQRALDSTPVRDAEAKL